MLPIRGHVFSTFPTLAMQKYPADLSCEAGVAPEWKALLRDLDRLALTCATAPNAARRRSGSDRWSLSIGGHDVGGLSPFSRRICVASRMPCPLA